MFLMQPGVEMLPSHAFLGISRGHRKRVGDRVAMVVLLPAYLPYNKKGEMPALTCNAPAWLWD